MSKNSYVLIQHEDLVFTILQEYFQKNRPFDMDKIIPYLNDRLIRKSIDINRAGIKKIMISLIKQKRIHEGTNLTIADVLTNIRRKKIFKFILSHPGTYFTKMVNELQFPNHVVTWHLSILRKFGFVNKEKYENRELYFDPQVNFDKVKQIHIASKDKSQKIINYLNNSESGLSKTQLAEALGMHHNTITKYIGDLENINLITKKEIGSKMLYFVKN
jgi:predicted transcriptional regulator